jgi:hypothetical protein
MRFPIYSEPNGPLFTQCACSLNQFFGRKFSTHLDFWRGRKESSSPKVEVVVPLYYSPFGACLFRSPHLYFPYEGNRKEHLGAKKVRPPVIDSERYYVQQRELQAFLVRELAAPSQEPGEEDRIVRVFLDRESAYHFVDAANDLQRKLDAHIVTPWSVRAV